VDEGGKQLGAVVIAIVVIIALIAIAKAVFGENGIVKTKITEELNKITSYEMTVPQRYFDIYEG